MFTLTASAIVLLPFDWPVETEDIKLWGKNVKKTCQKLVKNFVECKRSMRNSVIEGSTFMAF